ncbi:MAG: glycosyltransferase family 4 protein [Chloroflexi bacterium]|nr:glycosyltransferase family 4 protein [Chloroflexota bacterium]
MKLAIFLTPTFTRLSQSSTVNKFLGLLTAGWDVHVFTPDGKAQNWFYKPPITQSEVAQRIHNLNLKGAPTAAWWHSAAVLARHPLRGAGYWWRVWRLFGRQAYQKRDVYWFSQLVKFQPDLVHFEFGRPARQWIYLKTLLNCPVTVGFMATEFDYAVPSEFYRPVWQAAAAIQLPGDGARQAALRHGLSEDMPHAIIPPTLDLSFYDPGERPHRPHMEKLGSKERPLRLLSVDRLVWSKGFEVALTAVRTLLDQGIHCEYDIIGAGPYANALHFARKQLGLDDVVRFWGNQPRTQVRASLASADLFLHTAVAEGFCYAALEALAMKLPIVGTQGDGLAEHVLHGQTGFIVPRRDVAAIVEKISLLANLPQLRQQFGEAGRAYVERRLRPFDELAAYKQFFQQAVCGVNGNNREGLRINDKQI